MKKTTFSEANLAFKKHWWKFLLLDALFLVSAFVFFIYTRAKIKAYFALISQYSAQVSNVQQMLAQNSVGSMNEMTELLAILGPIAKQASFFTFFIVPLVIFALWCLFQAPQYSLILRNKMILFTNYLRFIVFAAPFYVAGLFLLNELFDITYADIGKIFSLKFILFFVLFIIVLYINQIFYAFTLKDRYREIAKSFACVIRRTYVMLPCYLLYAFAWMLALAGMVNFFLKWSASSNEGMLTASIPIIIALLLVGWTRTFFTVKAAKCA
ncbi:MAG: hypothetical protein PHO02_02435 [Candidatus Nanoarchaeia archaeon]|nr:hypothetical protein [Candidatus Nanoarchaeia archaeon]